jgi:hypothetical protein
MQTLLKTRLMLRALLAITAVIGFSLANVGCAENKGAHSAQVDQAKGGGGCCDNCGKCDPAKCGGKCDPAKCGGKCDPAKCKGACDPAKSGKGDGSDAAKGCPAAKGDASTGCSKSCSSKCSKACSQSCSKAAKPSDTGASVK